MRKRRADLRVILRQYVGHDFDEDKGSLKVTVHDGQGVPRVKNTAGDLMSIATALGSGPIMAPAAQAISRPLIIDTMRAGGTRSQPWTIDSA